MLDLKFIREHEAELRDTIARQKRDDRMEALDRVLALDAEWRDLKGQADTLRSQRNKVSESINKTKKEGGDISTLTAEAKAIPARIKEVDDRIAGILDEVKTLLRQIPNIMHPDVPYGEGDQDNPEIKAHGKKREFGFPIKTHVELCEALDLADFEASAQTSGNGFYFLKGDLGRLNQALIRYATDLIVSRGYTYIEPPLMVRRPILEAAMDLNAIQQSVYTVTDTSMKADESLCMIGTAEHAILGMHIGQTIEEAKLPLKYAGYSMCFRAEIGSHGINDKGLWRTHQFNKVEQFIFCLPEQSWALYDELLQNSEAILQGLGLPYRVIEICTGDLAAWKARSYDLEVWRPTTESYGEVMSLSNCTIYQANDLDIRYVKRDGERGIIHTLNNTALATSRIMVAILETFQEEDGSITIPEVLRPYMGGQERIVKK